YNFHPSKRLGQNFLIDRNIKDKIIGAAGLRKEDTVLEIGPGLGALTEGLVEKAGKVIAVEKDKRLSDFLLNNMGSNADIISADILDYDFAGTEHCSVPAKFIVVGNLPYSISSPILNKLIDNRSFISAAYVTVQLEFGERVVASAGTKDYGSLSCYARFYGKPEILFKIPRGAFFPVPDVDSCLLKIVFEQNIDSSIDQGLLFRIIRSSFEKRRKTILNSLASSGLFKSKEEAFSRLSETGISPTRRPETISLEEFITLSRHLMRQK
ncbi:MAG: 16S rRNA (adenine(1518)-N(6)/adenine(1519)-N(6))-dimethyltransferase RsmA, partial [Candidatus Omnitrophota bacterium]